jgi:hypothetical protein
MSLTGKPRTVTVRTNEAKYEIGQRRPRQIID